MIILDTDSLTHYTLGNKGLLKRWDDALEANPDEELAITVVTWFEAIRGRVESILKAEDEDKLKTAQARLRTTQALLDEFEVLTVSDQAANHFEQLRKLKKPKRRADMLIACIALAHNALLVTRNTKDFKGVTHLRIEDWVT
jgi:predicted nucleic acid-binding protein